MNAASEVVRLAQELIRIPSTNPDGSEAECAGFVREWLLRSGAQTQRQEVFPPQQGMPARENIIATLKGRGRKPALVLLAHLDTVPPGEGWETDPFAAQLREGRLYGRGASDMKGGLAASLLAFRRALRCGQPLQGDLILCATVDEEGPDMAGANAFARSGRVGPQDMVIAAEPTRNRLCLAHKGALWYRIEVRGRMAHAGKAHLGADANQALAWIITELGRGMSRWSFEHPLLGRPGLTVGQMAGGIKTNVVPNSSWAEVDLRIVPPISLEEANAFIRQGCDGVRAAVPGATAKVQPLGLQRAPLEVREEAAVVEAFRQGYRRAMGEELRIEGFPAYTDAGVVAMVTGNTQCVVFGPGDMDLAHTVNEYALVSELEAAERILSETILAALG